MEFSGDIFCSTNWEHVWETYRNGSILRTTQEKKPELWKQFFDHISGIWDEMSGNGSTLSKIVVDHLLKNTVIGPGKTALDIGCGPGSLSLCLARQGVRVTALDYSPAMIQILQHACAANDRLHVSPYLIDWARFSTKDRFDLVIASHFPDVMCPNGIERMESFSIGYCALVLGWGKEPFPIREKLWKALMEKPLPKPGGHLLFAFNHLMTSGRYPNVYHLEVPIEMDIALSTIREYYIQYFGIFGIQESFVTEAIDHLPAEWFPNQRFCASGTLHAALIWWRATR